MLLEYCLGMVSRPQVKGKSGKARLEEIQLIELNRENFDKIWPYLIVSIKAGTLVAVDLELSGLGARAGIQAKSIEERYDAIRAAAMSRSIVSLGVAVFKRGKRNEDKKRVSYTVQVFNILSLCAQPFTIEPEAMRFLSRHSFDFNKLVREAVEYQGETGNNKQCPLRSLFLELLCAGSPLALHNGIVDLAFLFHHLWAPLPEKYAEWIQDLSQLFPAQSPLVDSKYLAEYESRWTTSFLEYVFRKCQRENVREAVAGRAHIRVEFDSAEGKMEAVRTATERVDCSLPDSFPHHQVPSDLSQHICQQWASHGFCRALHGKRGCDKLHDVDYVLDLEAHKQAKARMRRKRRYDYLRIEKPKEDWEEESEGEEEKEKEENRVTVAECGHKKRIAVNGCHRAGVDAFMTGFAVLWQCRMGELTEGRLPDKVISRIPISGKPHPLLIQPSQFSVHSTEHEKRFVEVEKERRRREQTEQ